MTIPEVIASFEERFETHFHGLLMVEAKKFLRQILTDYGRSVRETTLDEMNTLVERAYMSGRLDARVFKVEIESRLQTLKASEPHKEDKDV